MQGGDLRHLFTRRGDARPRSGFLGQRPGLEQPLAIGAGGRIPKLLHGGHRLLHRGRVGAGERVHQRRRVLGALVQALHASVEQVGRGLAPVQRRGAGLGTAGDDGVGRSQEPIAGGEKRRLSRGRARLRERSLHLSLPALVEEPLQAPVAEPAGGDLALLEGAHPEERAARQDHQRRTGRGQPRAPSRIDPQRGEQLVHGLESLRRIRPQPAQHRPRHPRRHSFARRRLLHAAFVDGLFQGGEVPAGNGCAP